MSALRPTITNNEINDPVMRDGTAYLLIYRAVKDCDGLIHGQLHDGRGHHCAIGNYFRRHNRTALPSDLIDEVAAVNDSTPGATQKQRRLSVLRWLRWRLATSGVPEFARYQKTNSTRRRPENHRSDRPGPRQASQL
jgi:hypothetical protein